MVIECLVYYRDISTEEVKNLVKFSPKKEATKLEAVVSFERRGINSGSKPVEENGSNSGGFGADSKVGEELGSSLPLNRDCPESTIVVVLDDSHKANKMEDPDIKSGSEGEYEHGSEIDDDEQESKVTVEELYGVNNDNGKSESISAMEGVDSDVISSSSGEDEEEGETESDGEDEMEVDEGEREDEEEGADSEFVLERPSGDTNPVSPSVDSVIGPFRSGDVGIEDCVKPMCLNGDRKNHPVENKVGSGIAHNVLDELPQRGDKSRVNENVQSTEVALKVFGKIPQLGPNPVCKDAHRVFDVSLQLSLTQPSAETFLKKSWEKIVSSSSSKQNFGIPRLNQR
ncbi:hypothetical protein U1Q18_017864, partial [Sarracenia purpurea var. burkii]